MQYYLLSLPEASGLYLGLAFQAMIRGSSLAHYVAYLLITVGTLRLISAQQLRPTPALAPLLLSVGAYVAISFAICVIFWPEAVPVFGHVSRLSATQVASAAAAQDGAATIITAADTGKVVQDGTLETPGFRLLLGAITDMPLTFARALNPASLRPFSPIVSQSWLLGLDLTADVNRALADWVEGCWKPSMAQDMEFQQAITSQDLLPWGNTPVAQALATRETVPGSMTGGGYFRTPSPLGTAFLGTPGSSNTVRCDVYLAAVEFDVQRWLFASKSPAGVPLSQIFEEDLHLTVEQQARFLVYREALRALGRPAPAPSLAGAYAGLSAVQVGAGALGGLLGSVGQTRGGWLGSLFGGAGAAVNQFESTVHTLLLAVGLAMWFVYWSPFIVGTALQVLIGLFPVVVCYALIPGHQFKPLVVYFLALLYVCCSPLWFALVELAAHTAIALAPQTQDALLSTLNWAPAQIYGAVATVTGLVIVFAIGAGILFLSARGMIGAIRA
jgi:hypothetical protein